MLTHYEGDFRDIATISMKVLVIFCPIYIIPEENYFVNVSLFKSNLI